MTKFAEQLIQLALVTSCAMAFVVVISLFSMGAGLQFVGIFWLCMLGMSCLYAYSVWHRIPFAAANLTTGLEAVQTNAGVCMIAYGVSFAANLWVLIWALAFVGVSFKETKCDASTGTCDSDMDPISIFLLIFSHYWTSQVLKNVVHVTVAGVIGTWWFAPQEASHMWSPAIGDSFRRATTYSFGSICMASLLVALIRTLESAAASARRNGRGNQILLCIVECILRLIANIAEYFNKWALCYVGLYGYDFLTAGRKVVHLFRESSLSLSLSLVSSLGSHDWPPFGMGFAFASIRFIAVVGPTRPRATFGTVNGIIRSTSFGSRLLTNSDRNLVVRAARGEPYVVPSHRRQLPSCNDVLLRQHLHGKLVGCVDPHVGERGRKRKAKRTWQPDPALHRGVHSQLIANIAEYFNKWALCYVGLYGYDFLTAGRKVVHLFRERGWSAIISDNLAARVLFLVCLVIGALTGLVGVLLNSITGWATPSLGPDAAIVVFFMCAIIGLSLAWITMGVVLSAVDTVIVSFAEAPQEFEANHPRLCQQMKTAWRLVYPGECSF
eukprot:CAMPEP_0198134358 /NCGR_PEP_ID=MMETSP1442-20131203/60035_1 /TAXON_ID= /ORGANISM="Craspedostauros australis, Strain CCMP3328" /LENGTH=552 /DNA_ID=CAMNT_0043795501 /DNA_START=15 /DNA_END=1675 /DNA_ORIENTATION=+